MARQNIRSLDINSFREQIFTSGIILNEKAKTKSVNNKNNEETLYVVIDVMR